MNYRTERVIGWVDKRRGGRSGRCSGVGERRRWDGERDEVIEIHWEIQERERHKDTKVKTRGKEVKLEKKRR